MRASVLILGPLVSRFGYAKVSLPGGCAIGVRPIDLHLKVLEKLGAKITLKEGYVEAQADRLKGANFHFDKITVTGTINAVSSAVLAEGKSEFYNCALEPEVVQACETMKQMGAQISGEGTHTITVEGVESLSGFSIQLIPDRIETGTYLVAGAIAGGSLELTGIEPKHIRAVVSKLQEIGCEIKIFENTATIHRSGTIRPLDITTLPFPGFPTDMQAQFSSLLCLADGTSNIHETIFENRFMHVSELSRMGANLHIDGNTVTIKGVKKLMGAPVMATDLRASASLILAGLVAEGITEVSRIYHLDRGYERMDEKLSKLGAVIRRIPV